MSREFPLARSEALITEELDGELLVYDSESNLAHALDPDAAALWRACDGRTDAYALAARCHTSDESARITLARLQELGLLQGEQEGDTRRAALRKITLAGAGLAALPTISTILVPTAAQAASCVVTITEYPVPTAGSFPLGITAGPDGALWFTEQSGNNVGRVTTAGAFTEYPVPTAGSNPFGITAGPDGALWFTEQSGNKIGRVTTSGAFTEYPVPTAGSGPEGIVAGPDGALWFTESRVFQVGRITIGGSISEFSAPQGRAQSAHPFEITAGPDGALWFTEPGFIRGGGLIGRITTAGTVTEFSGGSAPQGIVAGPDGALWFPDGADNDIHRITTGGSLSTFPVGPLLPNVGLSGIAAGPDGALWFTETNANKIGRITTAGTVTGEFVLPTPNGGPHGITAGPDGALWFTEQSGNKIGRIAPC